MKNLLILVTIFAASALHADQPNDELGKLRESYTKAVERATAPLRVTYVAELKKLVEKHTKAGNLDAALAARTEFEAVSKVSLPPANTTVGSTSSAMPSVVTKPTESNGKLSTSEKKRIESYFAGKTWETLGSKAPEFKELQYFAKNGRGARKIGDKVTTDLNWTILEDGRVLVTLAGFEKHITFVSAEDAIMIVHFPPPKGDITYSLKVSNETIEGVR